MKSGAHRGQKKDPPPPRTGIVGICELPSIGSWELNSGSPLEQHALITEEPLSPQPPVYILSCG